MAQDVIAEQVGKLAFDVDDAGLKRFNGALQDAKRGSDSAGTSAVALGSFLGDLATSAREVAVELARTAVVAGVEIVTEFAHGAREIDNWAKKTGLTTTALQQLEGAAKSLGLEAEDVREGVQTWTESLGELTRLGSGPAHDALGSLGLRIEDLKDLRPEESLKIFADALRDLPTDAERTSVALEVLGGEGSKLRPLLDQGGAGIQALMDKASELGLVLDESAIAKGVETQRALDGLGATTQSLRNTIAAALAPTVTDLAERFGDWYEANEELIAQRVPEVVDAIVEGTAELIDYGQQLAGGLENLTSLFGRMGEEGQGGLGALVEHGETLVEWSKAGIELFVDWTDLVAEGADLVWDLGEAVSDGLGEAYEHVEPLIESVTTVMDDQESTLGRVVAFIEDAIDRVIELKGVVDGLVADIGIGRAFDPEALAAASENARAPATAARRAAEDERAYQERVTAHADRLIAEAQEAEATKERRKRGEAFRRKTLAAAAGGSKTVDTRAAERLLGVDIDALAQASGATAKARRKALEAAAGALAGGSAVSVAREAAASSLSGQTGADLKNQSADAALFGQLTRIGGAEDARAATDGARFVRIDQSQTNNITLQIPERYAQAMTAPGMAEGITAAVRAILVEDYRQIVDRGQGSVSP